MCREWVELDEDGTEAGVMIAVIIANRKTLGVGDRNGCVTVLK